MGCYITYESNIRKQLRKYPNPRTSDHNGNHVEDQTDNTKREEEAEQAQHGDAQIPHTEAHDGRPEREHDASEHDKDHEQAPGVGRPLGALVEPRVVLVWCEELLCDDLEGLGGGGGFPGRAPLLHAEEEGVGVDLFESFVRFLL